MGRQIIFCRRRAGGETGSIVSVAADGSRLEHLADNVDVPEEYNGEAD